jgi:hypothetical protein
MVFFCINPVLQYAVLSVVNVEAPVWYDALERFYRPWQMAYFRPFSNVISIKTSHAVRKNSSNMADVRRWCHRVTSLQILYAGILQNLHRKTQWDFETFAYWMLGINYVTILLTLENREFSHNVRSATSHFNLAVPPWGNRNPQTKPTLSKESPSLSHEEQGRPGNNPKPRKWQVLTFAINL